MSRQSLVAGVFSKFLSASITTLIQFLCSCSGIQISRFVPAVGCISFQFFPHSFASRYLSLFSGFYRVVLCVSPLYSSLHSLVLCVFVLQSL
jgi:hypothetical protein